MLTYSSYKDSEVKWIGAIPSSWSVISFKRTHNGTNVGESIDKEFCTDNVNDYTFYTAGLNPIRTNYPSFPEWKKTQVNDLLLARNGTPYVYLPLISSLYSDHIIRVSIKDTFDKRFLRYCLQQSINTVAVDTVSISTWSASLWNEQKIPLPSFKEQQSISHYLDKKVSHIDSLIADAKASIEEYKQWKATIIYEAVTKGLDPNVEMKDSGVEWIGEIPVSWNFIKITRLLDRNHPYPIGDGDHGLVKSSDYIDSGIPYIRVQNLGWGTPLDLENVVYISESMNESIKNSTLYPDDILFAKTGATIGKTAIVPDNLPISNTTSHVGKITVNKTYNARFVFYVLSSMVGFNQFWEIASAKTTRPELSIEEIKSLQVTMPSSRDEQDRIVEYLDSKIPHIDALIHEKEALISDLESYKKSLIFEVVTGKRKVV